MLGYITEVNALVNPPTVAKHYTMGRKAYEMTLMMPDGKTSFGTDDGASGLLTMVNYRLISPYHCLLNLITDLFCYVTFYSLLPPPPTISPQEISSVLYLLKHQQPPSTRTLEVPSLLHGLKWDLLLLPMHKLEL